MLEHGEFETASRQAMSERSSLSLTWRLDPATGKPVARWTSQQPEKVAGLELPVAA
jgi:hypothetical protein